MARTKRRADVRITPPDALLDEYTRALTNVQKQMARGNTSRTIWNEILDRTQAALDEYKHKDLEQREEQNG